MASEKDFLERRLEIIEKRLEQPNEYDVHEKGRFHLRFQNAPTVEWGLIREARLLKKLLVQVQEGKISKALRDWRKYLGEELHSHREFYQPVEDAHDAWLSLPFPTRVDIPEPPLPPDLVVVDAQGLEWIVDDHLLAVLEDVSARLKKWLEEE
jgi:hypothetical protein